MTLPTAPASHPSPAHDPWWQRLHAWIASATSIFTASPAHVTRGQLAPLLGWIYIIEALLRRLVLLAASALRLTLAPARKQRRQRTARPTPRTQRHPAFRLIGFRAPPPARHGRASLPRIHRPRPGPAAMRPFLAWQTHTLISAHNRFDASSRHASRQPRAGRCTPPPPPYELATRSRPTNPARSSRLRRINARTIRAARTRHTAAPRTRPASSPASLRLAALAAAPDSLIRRAAFRLARLTDRKRFALAQCPPPHPRRQTRAFTPHFRSLVIPAHHLWLRTPSPNTS